MARSDGVGQTGSGPGEFNVPHAIAVDSRGRLFVADRANNRIQIFDQTGTSLTSGRSSGGRAASRSRATTRSTWRIPSRGARRTGLEEGIRIGSARDGSVKLLHRGHRVHDRRAQRRGGVGVDRAATSTVVVRRMMLEKHILQKR
jgi:hypothetical protein